MQPQQNKQDSQDGQDGEKEQPLMCMPNEAIAGIDEQAVGQVCLTKVSSNAEGLVRTKSSPEVA